MAFFLILLGIGWYLITVNSADHKGDGSLARALAFLLVVFGPAAFFILCGVAVAIWGPK